MAGKNKSQKSHSNVWTLPFLCVVYSELRDQFSDVDCYCMFVVHRQLYVLIMNRQYNELREIYPRITVEKNRSEKDTQHPAVRHHKHSL